MLVELDDKRDDLQETEYEKYISDQQNMLDTMMTDFKEIISKKLEDFMTIVQEGLSVANENTSTINSTLSDFANKASYKVEFTNTISLNTVEGYLARIATATEATVKDPTNTGGTTGSGSTNSNSGNNGSSDNSYTDGGASSSSTTFNTAQQMYPVLSSAQRKAYKEFVLSKGSKKLSKDIGKYTAVNQALYKGRGVVLSSSELKSLAKKLGIYRSDDKWDVNGYMYQTFKKNKLKGFKHGGIVDDSFDLLKKQVKANGDTTIVSANPGEGILTPVVTDNFIKFANSDLVNNFSPIEDSLKDITKMVDTSQIAKPISNNNIGDVSFNFELPNVTDEKTFLKAIQTDPSVQKAIQSLTIGQMMGKSRLGVRSIK